LKERNNKMRIKLDNHQVKWIRQALQREYAYYLKNYGNEKYNSYTDQVHKLFAQFHALNNRVNSSEVVIINN
jgi:23S rRNA U2552 (ribose-2'-O)-methylase RlmE/FtsJ